MNLRKLSVAFASLGLVAAGTLGGIAATSASAAPPVKHVVTATAITTRVQEITPRVSVINSLDYGPSAVAPGFVLSGRTTEVCVTVPHVVPPTPLTVLAVCSWKTTFVPLSSPVTTLSGNAFVTGLGQVGRVLHGSGAWDGLFAFPLSFRSSNIAPRVAADTFTFFTP
jgi:hypothetical protein